MNKQDAAKLLSLIKLSYPTAYRDIDRDTANATVNMWAMSFADVPYPIMEQAFNHFRMASKFPPTVAEMVDELKKVYFSAVEGALIHKQMGNQEVVDQYRQVMAYTARYKDVEKLGGLSINSLPRMLGGEANGQAYYGCNSGTEGRDELRKLEGASSSY